MNATTGQFRFPPRWVSVVGLWLFLAAVWASELYFNGHVKSWGKAFGQEVVYWLSWGIVAPLVFWLCRRLHSGGSGWNRHVLGLLLGAIGATIVQLIILKSLAFTRSWLEWQFSLSSTPPASFLGNLPLSFLKSAGGSVTIYVAIVLAWYAGTYYREARDRQVQSLELESLLHQARLEALRSQLHPHFLFNTLHSIAEFIHEDPKLAEQLILRLGGLLRTVLSSAAQQEVPLGEEIEFVKAYLEIEQMRLGDRLQVQWQVAPNAPAALVPSMILQPLVENAIQHGIVPLEGAGKLWISAICDDGFLSLQVRDNGPGLKETSKAQGKGLGLSNTEARLRRLYGEQQRFELRNNNGLEVNVRLPFHAKPTGNNESSRADR